MSLSKLTKYCACHQKWISWLILVAHETLFTMRGVTTVIVQTHQILRLPRKMNLMIDPCHTWNAIYNARSNKCHCPNSPNTAPATQNDSPKFCKNFSKTAETSFPMRGRSENDPRMIRAGNRPPQPASQQRWLFALATSIFYWKIQHFALRLSFQISPNTAPATKSDSSTSPTTAPGTQNDCHDWSSSHMKCHLQCAEQPVSSSNITEYCACHEKWISWLIPVTHERLFTMRGATSVIVQTHQILRLPRKMILIIDPCHTWNAIYNARSNKCHCPNSPNTAPATQNDSPKFCKNFSKTAETSFPMRGRSENDPSNIRAGNRPPQPASQPRLLFTPTTSILYWKIQHFALRLSFQISPNTAPATKSDTSTSPNTAPATKSDTWTSPNSAPATKSDTWTSPNSAPATKSDTWTPPNSAPATKSHTTLLYPSLVFATILLRISSQTNLISYESNLLRISSQTNLISNASNLLRISSQTNLFSNESLLKRI